MQEWAADLVVDTVFPEQALEGLYIRVIVPSRSILINAFPFGRSSPMDFDPAYLFLSQEPY